MHDRAGIWSSKDQNSRSSYGYDPLTALSVHNSPQSPDTLPKGDAGDGQEGGKHEGEKSSRGGEEQQEEEHQGDRQEPGRG